MSTDQVASLVRHLATFFGGYLMAKLAIPPEYMESIVGGLAAIAAVIWGIIAKKPVTSTSTSTVVITQPAPPPSSQDPLP